MYKNIILGFCCMLCLYGLMSFIFPKRQFLSVIKTVFSLTVFAFVFFGIVKNGKIDLDRIKPDFNPSSVSEYADKTYNLSVEDEYKSKVKKYVENILSENKIDYERIEIITDNSENKIIVFNCVNIILMNNKQVITNDLKNKIEEYAKIPCNFKSVEGKTKNNENNK